jgi:two-component system nitrate/nitrite response regulator NarL
MRLMCAVPVNRSDDPGGVDTMFEVVLVAPVRAYREAFSLAFGRDPDIRIVAHASSFSEAVSAIAPRHPAVTLIDFAIADFLSVLASAKRAAPSTLTIGFGIEPRRDNAERVVRAAEAGLAGFIDADQPIEDVVGAVRLALRGESSCSPRVAAILLHAMRAHPEPPHNPGPAAASAVLTPRERVVADLASRGLTNRQIAARLVVGESTVKTHVHSVLAKLGVTHRSEIMLSERSSTSTSARDSTGGG